jgi:hypothetical protein
LPLNIEDQAIRLSKAARILAGTQARNAASALSHAKAKHERLLALNIHVQTLRCCIPPPSG